MTCRSLPTNIRIPRCPMCNSVRIQTIIAAGVGTETEGRTTYFLNRTHESCSTCGHTWNRRARRGVAITNEPAPKRPGLISRFLASLTRLW